MVFLTRVVNMQYVLDTILGKPGEKNMGQKYLESNNIWINLYLEDFKEELKYNQIPIDDLKMGKK